MADEEYEGSESEGVKSLRKALEKKEQEIKERDEKLNQLLARDRQRTIADKFTEFKINPKIAKMVPSDVEVDKLEEWIGENADWLGVNLSNDNNAHADESAAQNRINSVTNQPPGEQEDPDMRAVMATTSVEELTQLILARQAGVR